MSRRGGPVSVRSVSMRPTVPDLVVERRLLAAGATRVAGMDEVGRGALAGPVTVGVAVVTATTGDVPAGLRDSKALSAAARRALVDPLCGWVAEHAIGHATPAEVDRWGIMTGLALAGTRALAALSAPVDAVVLDGNVDFLAVGGQLAEAGQPAEAGRSGLGNRIGDARGGAMDGGLDDVLDGVMDHVLTRAAPLRATGPTTPSPGGIPLPAPAVHLQVKADARCASVAAASVLAKTTRDAMMTELARRFPGYGWETNAGYGTAAHRAALANLGACVLHRRSWRLPSPPGGAMGDDGP